MKLGFVSAILPELALKELFEFSRAEGFSTVEVVCWPVGKAERKFAGVTHIDVAELTGSHVQEIRSHAHETGVSISALGYYPNMLDADAAVASAAVTHFKKGDCRRRCAGAENRQRVRRAGLDPVCR